MLWLSVVVFSNVLLAFVSLVDKYLLTSVAVHPRIYTFYVGVLGMLVFLLVPFVGFSLPGPWQLFLAIGAGILFLTSLFWFFKGLKRFEASRIIPLIGAFIPLFTLAFVWIASKGSLTLTGGQFLAFLFLIAGSVLITVQRGKEANLAVLRVAFLSAFFLSLAFVMMKYVYLAQPFWSGFMLFRVGGFLVALWFLLSSREVWEEIFRRKNEKQGPSFWKRPRIAVTFFLNQSLGAVANILQSFAVFLVPLSLLPFVNALGGVQYAVLFVCTLVLSMKFPRFLQEELSQAVVFQKLAAIGAIITGVVILALV
jgi:hypothetical protein